MLKVLDLFAGIGGLSLGFKQAAPGELDIVQSVDSDRTLIDSYAYNALSGNLLIHEFPDPLREPTNIRQLASEFSSNSFDIILAGPPCQTFSPAGQRSLRWDATLAYYVCDFVSVFQPYFAVIENVPEFATAQDQKLLGRIRVQLHEAGYSTDFVVLNAANFGVPQNRLRCFTVAVRLDRIRKPLSLRHMFAATHNALSSNVGRRTEVLPTMAEPLTPTVAAAIGDLPPLKAGEGGQEMAYSSSPTTEYQALMRGHSKVLYNHQAASHSHEMVSKLSKLLPGETPQSTADHELRRKAYFRGAYARLDPNKVATTITTQTHNPGSGRFTHYRDHRVITVREAARLQGFPDSFKFFGTQSNQRKHVGNAVPPPLAQHIAERLLQLL